MTHILYSVAVVALCATVAGPASPKLAQDFSRAKAGMPFDRHAAVHHFLLTRAGGAIQVEVRDPADTASRDAIRAHLREIAADFVNGNFDAPFATHGEAPPGVEMLQRLKDAVTYTFVLSANGGRVVIATGNPDALAAIHQFLRYQIKEHHTGDSTSVR